MKREIEFRGQRADNKEWVYGSFINSVVKGITFGYIAGNNVVEPIQIMRKTVGQYVGIKDKNGKKVYEGDRVKVTYIEKRKYQGVAYDDEHCLAEEVFYSEENACFMLKVMCGDIPMYRPLHNFESLAKIKEIEVIGNIFDKESDNGD